jgi:nitrogen fixation-related uncharacterized protein
MEAIVLILAVVVALVGLDLAAMAWGVDSRDQFADDFAG